MTVNGVLRQLADSPHSLPTFSPCSSIPASRPSIPHTHQLLLNPFAYLAHTTYLQRPSPKRKSRRRHDSQRITQGRPTPVRAPPRKQVQSPDPPHLARCLRALYPALLLGSRPPAFTRRRLLRHVLPGARAPRLGGALRARTGLGVQEDPQLPRRASARAPRAEVHLHLYRRLCVPASHLAASPAFFLFSSLFVKIMMKIKVKASAGQSLSGGRGSSTLSTPGGVAGAGAGGLGEGGAHSDYQENRVLVRSLTRSRCPSLISLLYLRCWSATHINARSLARR